MKTFLYVLTLMVLPFCMRASAPPIIINEPFYTFQAGITGGFNIASEPVDAKGFHVGGMIRWGHHAFGPRFERETKSKNGWSTRFVNKHTKIGGYYSFTFAQEHFQWGPQIGIGKLEYDYREIANGQYVNVDIQTDTYFEFAVYLMAGARGNGIGGKLFVLTSAIEKYVGFTIFVQAGYAWNSK